MMALTSWVGTAGDGDWETSGNWSNGQPTTGDSVYFSPAATNGPTVNVDRGADATDAGLVLVDCEVARNCTYDIASSGTPLKIKCSGRFKHEGSGTVYWQNQGGSSTSGTGSTSLIVDSTNAQHAMTVSGNESCNRVVIENGYVNMNLSSTTQHLLMVPSTLGTTLRVVGGVTGWLVTNSLVYGGTLDTTSRHNYINIRAGKVINRNDLGGGGFGFAYVDLSGGIFVQRLDNTLDFGNTLYVYAIGGTLDTTKIARAICNELYVGPSATILRGAGFEPDTEIEVGFE